MNKLFVYGTLKQGAGITHRLPGYMMFKVRGRDFSFPVIQPYPWNEGIQPDVLGTVVDVSDEELEKLDVYEGVSRGLYKRVQASVFASSSNIAVGETVWVYVGGPALVHEPIPEGVWET